MKLRGPLNHELLAAKAALPWHEQPDLRLFVVLFAGPYDQPLDKQVNGQAKGLVLFNVVLV